MKLTTKSASILIAVLAASTVGGSIVTAAEVSGDAKSLKSTGKVEVKGDGDTGGPDTDGKIPDPETDGGIIPSNPDEVDYNKEKGPIKVESVTHLDFGEIETTAKTIEKYSAAIETSGGKRGAMVTFADVRSDVYGYKLQAQLTQPFTSGSNVLNGATISYKNAIVKPETDNTNTPGKFKDGAAFELGSGEDGKTPNAVEVFVAEEAGKEGKGRYSLEYGQSDDFKALPTTIGQGLAGSAEESVKLTVPMKTASNMAKGVYEAKVTWSIVTAP